MEGIIKMIVVDSDEVIRRSLKSHLDNSNKIKIVSEFSNGEEALVYLVNHTKEVDVILMDLIIPGLDGVALLEELKKREIRIKTIVLTEYKDDKIIKDCSKYDISYYLLKPCSLISLEKRIIETTQIRPLTKTVIANNVDFEISQILHDLGIPSHIRGFKYLREGILLIYNNEQLSRVTKEIYPKIADKYDTTPTRVERAIRHAIEVSCIRGNYTLMDELFGYSMNSEKAKPTNAEFLTTIADRIKIEGCLN